MSTHNSTHTHPNANANASTRKRSGIVLVASTRAARGEYVDRSGPIAVEFLRSLGIDTPEALVVEDGWIEGSVDKLLTLNPPHVLLTSGGTGVTPDDRTIEALTPHLTRELPGLVAEFFARGRASTPTAALSRCVAGLAGTTFVMALPGSTGGVRDGCAVLEPVLTHLLDQVEGSHEH